MKIRVSNSLFVILVSAVLWQPVSAAAEAMILRACGAVELFARFVSFQPAGDMRVGRRRSEPLSPKVQ